MSALNSVIVDTEYGPVKGVKLSTDLGRDFFKFTVVPFMKAPLAKLRFRDAQAPDCWNQPLDTTGDRPSYTSFNFMDNSISGQENAGIVTVATPYLDRKLPVAVYIHGGGFQIASGMMDMYGPDYLLQKDIVLVTINYRVGPIGFLSLKDPELNIPGNAGLKDQIFALKWVQKNIANFGGDANNVTLIGTSAGAVSVHYLMISDLAKGLFNKAIPMSGTSFIKTWAFADKRELTSRLAKGLGWDGTGGEKKILEILENADAKKIVEVESKLLTKEEVFQEHVMFPFTPVIEPYVTKNTLIPEDPVLMSRKAWSNDIDCIIGMTSLEGSLLGMHQDFSHFYDFIQSSDNLVTREVKLNPSKDQKKISEVGKKLQKFYFGEKTPSADTRLQYLLYASDILFVHGVYRAVLSRVNSSGSGKTFFYRFNGQTDLNFGKMVFKITEEGSSHGEDFVYLFKAHVPMFAPVKIESKEFEMIKKMVSIVTSFIINGNPNTSDITFDQTTSKNPFNCLNISNDLIEMFELPEKERMKFWDGILKDANIPLY